jgi:hypothetical protein
MTNSGFSMQAIELRLYRGAMLTRSARAGEDAPFGKVRAGSATAGGTPALRFGGEVVADAADGVALGGIQGEEFEAVAEALAVADNGADFDGIGR